MRSQVLRDHSHMPFLPDHSLVACVSTVIVIWACLSGCSRTEDDPCTVAYGDGDKTSEFETCKRAAIAGDAQAELGYGLALFSGHNRANDRAAGLEWLRKSARQGNRLAQVSLGNFLSRLPKDDPLANLVEAYAWFTLSGSTKAASELADRMTASQISDSKRLAAEYLDKYGRNRAMAESTATSAR